MVSKKTNISNKAVAYNGAAVAVAAVFAYSIIVMIYTIIRSSTTIYSIMPGSERNTILLTNSFSVAYSVAVFSLLMSIISAAAGGVAATILKKILHYYNPKFNFRKAVFISCITALVLLAVMYFLLYTLLKERITFNYAETFLFWFLFPAINFFAACIIGGSKLNKSLKSNKKLIESKQ